MEFPESHERREHAAGKHDEKKRNFTTHNRRPEPPCPQRQGNVEHKIANAIESGTQSRALLETARQIAIKDIGGKARGRAHQEGLAIAIPGEDEQYGGGHQTTSADKIWEMHALVSHEQWG